MRSQFLFQMAPQIKSVKLSLNMNLQLVPTIPTNVLLKVAAPHIHYFP